MAHLALYREWRPQSFSEVVSQEQVVFPLQQAVSSGDIGHAFLFSGCRGTGKTSLAKILAKAVNCLDPVAGNPCNRCAICQEINKGQLLDVLEIDAASNNSVDNIRRITEEVVYMPSKAKYKVYIIDEVHMLSPGAFNALLKTLEEPPAHVIFILATTEPQRLPATILSRCQRYDFRRIPQKDIEERLALIATEKGIDIDADALQCIARLGDGALRDAISLLDQARSGIEGQISKTAVLNLVGLVQDKFMSRLTTTIFSADPAALLVALDELVMSGRDLARFLPDFALHLRNVLLCQMSQAAGDLLQVSAEELAQLQEQARLCSSAALIAAIEYVSRLASELKWAADPRTTLEIALISLLQKQAVAPAAPASTPATVVKTQAAAPAQAPAPAPTPNVAPPPPVEPPVEPPVQVEFEADRVSPAKRPSAAEPSSAFNFPSANTSPSKLAKTAPAEHAPQPEVEPKTPCTAAEAWQSLLTNLKTQRRPDIYLLLAPATVKKDGSTYFISYPAQLKAHATTLKRADNLVLMQNILSQITGTSCKVEISQELSPEEEPAANLNPPEAAWVQNLRQICLANDVPLEFSSPDDTVPEDDEMPF